MRDQEGTGTGAEVTGKTAAGKFLRDWFLLFIRAV